jgi:hypothetical protein
MGAPRVSAIKEFRIVAKLLLHRPQKAIAYEEKVSLSFVAKTKMKYPLFFWKTKRRYNR